MDNKEVIKASELEIGQYFQQVIPGSNEIIPITYRRIKIYGFDTPLLTAISNKTGCSVEFPNNALVIVVNQPNVPMPKANTNFLVLNVWGGTNDDNLICVDTTEMSLVKLMETFGEVTYDWGGKNHFLLRISDRFNKKEVVEYINSLQ